MDRVHSVRATGRMTSVFPYTRSPVAQLLPGNRESRPQSQALGASSSGTAPQEGYKSAHHQRAKGPTFSPPEAQSATHPGFPRFTAEDTTAITMPQQLAEPEQSLQRPYSARPPTPPGRDKTFPERISATKPDSFSVPQSSSPENQTKQ